jgi:hypothetical protein
MAVRTFTDDEGRLWRVWATVPGHRALVAEEFRSGWLTFEHGTERRRLAPAPSRWERMSDAGLVLALRVADVVRSDKPSDSEPGGGSDQRPDSGMR